VRLDLPLAQFLVRHPAKRIARAFVASNVGVAFIASVDRAVVSSVIYRSAGLQEFGRLAAVRAMDNYRAHLNPTHIGPIANHPTMAEIAAQMTKMR